MDRPPARARARRRIYCLAGLIAALFLLISPAGASAYIYWNHVIPGTIGRSNLDGSDADQTFITTGNTSVNALAVDPGHIYWAGDANSIGRANLNGTGVEPQFITGADHPDGVAVDGAHIYWSNNVSGGIGRADLNGSNINQQFIPNGVAEHPAGVAVDGGHVYWTDTNQDRIGRAKLDGSEAEASFIKVTQNSHPIGLAVDAGHIYWSDEETSVIGRAKINGTEVELDFIEREEIEEEIGEEEIEGESRYGLALDASHIYWANDQQAKIGRANIDGSEVEPSLLRLSTATAVAVDGGSQASPDPTMTTVTCSPGEVTLPGSTTCTATVSAAGTPTGTVTFSASGAGTFALAAGCTLVHTAVDQAACQLAYSPDAAGTQTIHAAYAGDEADGASGGDTTIATAGLTVLPALQPISPSVPLPPSNAFSVAKPKLKKKAGGAALTVTVPGPGVLVLTGAGIKKESKLAEAAGHVTLAVKPSPKTIKKLKKAGQAKVKVTATLTFTPIGGDPSSHTVKLTLKAA